MGNNYSHDRLTASDRNAACGTIARRMLQQQLIIVESDAVLILLGLALIVFLLLWSASTLRRHHARRTESQDATGSKRLDERPRYEKPERCPSCQYDVRASLNLCPE